MPPCAEAGCAAIATDGDRCAVHGRGLRRHHVAADAENTLRCRHCRRLIHDGAWYRLIEGGVTHANECVQLK